MANIGFHSGSDAWKRSHGKRRFLGTSCTAACVRKIIIIILNFTIQALFRSLLLLAGYRLAAEKRYPQFEECVEAGIGWLAAHLEGN